MTIKNAVWLKAEVVEALYPMQNKITVLHIHTKNIYDETYFDGRQEAVFSVTLSTAFPQVHEVSSCL